MKEYIATLNKTLLKLIIDTQSGKCCMYWGYVHEYDTDGNDRPYILAITNYFGVLIPQHECYIALPENDYKETGIHKCLPERTGEYFGHADKCIDTSAVYNEIMNDSKKHSVLHVNDDLAIDCALLKNFGTLANLSIYASSTPYMYEVYYGDTLIGVVMGIKRRKAAQD